MKSVWQSEWGEFEIPGDVPMQFLRKDGWFDRRRKVTKKLRTYFETMSIRKRDRKPIMTWAEWDNLK